MSVYIYTQAHVAVCVPNICALSPHSRWAPSATAARVPRPRLAWHPRSGRGDVLPVPASPLIPTCHCPPHPPRWHCHPAQRGHGPAVTAVPTKGVGGSLCSPGFQGLVFAGIMMRLVRSSQCRWMQWDVAGSQSFTLARSLVH